MRKYLVTLIITSLLLSSFAISVLAQGAQNVELHGYMLNRFYANPDRPARFVTDRVSLSAVGQLGGDAIGYIEVYFHPWITDRVIAQNGPAPVNGYTADRSATYLESAYLDLPFAKGRLRFGKGRQLNFGLTPTYPNRKTTQYGILAETFTQDRIIGAQYDYKCGAFDAGASFYTDQRVESRKIGDFAGNDVNELMSSSNVVAHIVDKDDTANNPGMLAGALRFGLTRPSYQIHVSGATGKMVADDVNTLTTAFGIASTSTKHNKYGVDGSYSFGPYVLQAEAYQGDFSFLTVTGYSVLVGYQPKDKARFYARWAAINNNKSPNNTTSSRQLTWAPQQLTIGVIQPIRKGVWVEVDYEKNTENTGGYANGDPKNDMLFAEFFTGF